MAKIRRLQILFLVVLIPSSALVFFRLQHLISQLNWVGKSYESNYFSRAESWKRMLKSSNHCPLPALNPFDREIMNITPLEVHYSNCSNFTSYFKSAVDVFGNPLLVRKSSFPDDKWVCCCSIMEAMMEAPFRLAQPCEIILRNPKIISRIPIPAETHLVEIKCIENETYFLKLNVTKGNADLFETNLTHKELVFFVPEPNSSKKYEKPENRPLNVILFGLDGVSRMNLIRLMRSTYQYLQKLGAIELQGYNSVASSTLMNSLAFLTGLNLSTVRSTCWENDGSRFDSCPWIWKSYKERGYTTLFAEDYYSVFNYFLGGFRLQPTDYYFFPFGERLGVYTECVGETPMLKFIENYAKLSTSKLKDVASFQVYWSGRTWISPTDPFFVDESVKKLLRFWKEDGILEKSVVIFLSDHGYKLGELLEKKQGLLENKMPFAFLLMPEWFRRDFKEAYSNLEENQWRLTTPFDIHATLKDLLDVEALLKKEDIQKRILDKVGDGATSLFLPIPKDRSCKQAGIDEVWCICDNYQPFNLGESVISKDLKENAALVNRMGEKAVETINGWLSPHRNICMEYQLWKVLDADKRIGMMMREDETEKAYRIRFQVKPQGAIFQAVLFHDEKTEKIEMSREIFRTNYFAAVCLRSYEFWHVCTCSDSADNPLV